MIERAAAIGPPRLHENRETRGYSYAAAAAAVATFAHHSRRCRKREIRERCCFAATRQAGRDMRHAHALPRSTRQETYTSLCYAFSSAMRDMLRQSARITICRPAIVRRCLFSLCFIATQRHATCLCLLIRDAVFIWHAPIRMNGADENMSR